MEKIDATKKIPATEENRVTKPIGGMKKIVVRKPEALKLTSRPCFTT